MITKAPAESRKRTTKPWHDGNNRKRIMLGLDNKLLE
jgi:hypothetical protein